MASTMPLVEMGIKRGINGYHARFAIDGCAKVINQMFENERFEKVSWAVLKSIRHRLAVVI